MCAAGARRASHADAPSALPAHLIAPTGGDQMQMGRVLPMTPRRVKHRDGTTSERLAPDVAREILQALPPTAHERAQHDRSVLVEGRAEHGRDRQDDVAIDDPLGEDLPHLAHPVGHGDFGTPQAQGRWTTHRHQRLPLATLQAAVFAVPHLLRVATPKHLGHQAIIVGRLGAWMGVGDPVPVLGKDLFENVPVPRGCCKHEGAPRGGEKMVTVKRFSHALPASSTPHRPVYGHPHPPLSSLINGGFRDRENAFSYTIKIFFLGHCWLSSLA
jgi:hypothetical protein